MWCYGAGRSSSVCIWEETMVCVCPKLSFNKSTAALLLLFVSGKHSIHLAEVSLGRKRRFVNFWASASDGLLCIAESKVSQNVCQLITSPLNLGKTNFGRRCSEVELNWLHWFENEDSVFSLFPRVCIAFAVLFFLHRGYPESQKMFYIFLCILYFSLEILWTCCVVLDFLCFLELLRYSDADLFLDLLRCVGLALLLGLATLLGSGPLFGLAALC